MTKEEIIQGLRFTIDMFLLDPNTGETITEPRNDMDKITIDACKGAIKKLQDNSYELWKESYEVEHQRNIRLEEKIKVLEQESKIKILNHDEVARRLGTVDIYQARAWTTLLKDLEYLKLKICEVYYD